MVTLSLSDAHAEALKRLADEAGMTAEELLGAWIARFGASDPNALSRTERERRLRELEGRFDLDDADLSLKAGQIMRETFSAKRD